ncbi:MAG: vanadium-dependent haloperoxidase [Acidimicrobiales bacterium]|nr:vanadium-dependent haloperoxidase [Acidimicrobiales bacterium]
MEKKPTARWMGVVAGATALLVAAGAVVLAATRGGDGGAECERTAGAERSVAREWDEAALEGIRHDFPAPTVHARNLFHLSVAMWDAWAAYDPAATGYLVDEDHTADDVTAAREEAISYAAYGVLVERYLDSPGAEQTVTEFDQLMASLCYPIDVTTTEGDSPAAVGNRVAAAVVARGLVDGSNEEGRYADPGYEPVNPPLVVDQPGTRMVDPNRWQPLELEVMIGQNGLPMDQTVQTFVGPQWGHVEPFALPAGSADGLPIDPGPPPLLGDPATDQAYKEGAVEVVRYSSELDPSDGEAVDIGPGALGDNPLGTNDGDGHDVNPATGEPYEPNVVLRGDYGRVLAEFWADGPRSELPPGHWNVLANEVSDDPRLEHRIGGTGPVVDRLEWDVKLYVALNGALHDAAVAAWGVKGHYDSVRPISMIRYLGGLGQSSDPGGPSYDPEGLPLVPGLVEVVTAESSAPGQRHQHLADHVGEIAVRSWTGDIDDPETDQAGVGWVRAVEWVPYQRETFVTPAFAGYVSGHSTFSHAGAEVLTAITGSPYFPGGLAEHTVPAGGLEFEAGPTTDVTLQWATYDDAADQAGTSRLWGGIHVRADDLTGRRMGAQCGIDAWALARRHYGGTATPDGDTG